jgi:hypothetical protein
MPARLISRTILEHADEQRIDLPVSKSPTSPAALPPTRALSMPTRTDAMQSYGMAEIGLIALRERRARG